MATSPLGWGEEGMKHFDLSAWTDFVRGTAAAGDHAAMEAHLARGCAKCGRSVEILRNFAAAAASGSQYSAPEYMIQCAKAIFSLQQPEKVHILPRILARLVYDSFLEPLPAGIRSQQRLSRQTLYEAGDFRLDLRLEQERGSTRVSLVGQIEDRKDPSRKVGSVPVLLAAGKEIVAKTISNQFGEFQFSYEPKSRLRLYVPIFGEHGAGVDVLLAGLAEETPASRIPGRRGGRK